jgi:beta-glucosidase
VIHSRPQDVETELEGVRDYVSERDGLRYHPGCSVKDDGAIDISEAVTTAQDADVVILVVGEGADMSGEAHSRAHLGLPGRQGELLDAISETGTPIVAVVMSGRPLVIPEVVERVDALLAAWHGGIRAGRAVADILFGTANPSGKLSASWPRTEGQIPVYYAQKNTGRPAASEGTKQFTEAFKSTYLDEPNSPLFPFGFGLSYTTFTYGDLRIERETLGLNDELVVTAVVQNTGPCAGEEVVQLYVRDLVGSVTRPLRELKGFQRITLSPGEAQTVRFDVPVRSLGFIGQDMHYVVEPGDFTVWVGPDSGAQLEGTFTVL